MSVAEQKTIYLKDYTVPEFLISHTDLHFELSAESTCVRSRLQIQRNPDCKKKNPDLVLMGEELSLISIAVNGHPLASDQYTLTEETLTLHHPNSDFVLEITNRINPSENTALSGLYQSKTMLCTQCEAEGFRRITWYLDRPDVMSIFSVTLVADKDQYPVLLSNGNCTKRSNDELDNNKHSTQWLDPFPKPSYLFALVAGNLTCLTETFTSCSGRDIALEIYVEEHDLDKTQHAMQSLKNAMRWDEKAFGREYDLDLYMIVAVSHFNMGAMENKGLNIFNTKYVLANEKTATDTDFENIEAVIGHEYFHNWSGNRVTCRDWFQLSLKEGFTVFRDQQFTAHQTSEAVKRIKDVNMLRTHQFAEDASPLAHPIRPDSFVEINNFYTLTIYEKGAEVVRMLHTLLNEAGFRKGCDLYFERHDGQAVTTEDFVHAMEDANQIDLSQFKNWYSQAGTPVITVSTEYKPDNKTYTLTFSQHQTGQTNNGPLLIPVRLGLIDKNGQEINIAKDKTSLVLKLTQTEQQFTFSNLDAEPTPSILRGFSAPIKLEHPLSVDQQLHLFQHDTDPFNRWESGQNCLSHFIFNAVSAIQNNQTVDPLSDQLVETFRAILQRPLDDLAYQTLLLSLPSKAYLAEQMETIDVDALYQAHRLIKQNLALSLKDLWTKNYQANHYVEAGHNPQSIAQRSFKNLCLDYLMALEGEAPLELCIHQFEHAQNMTDQIAALGQLSHLDSALNTPFFDAFYQQWKHEDLVIDKWFTLQACSEETTALEKIKKLLEHPDFDLKTPNRVRSVIGAFASSNLLNFNAENGAGYAFVADHVITLDAINPQIAARLTNSLSHWRKFDPKRQQLIKAQLSRIQAHSPLSKDVSEIVNRSLTA